MQEFGDRSDERPAEGPEWLAIAVSVFGFALMVASWFMH